MNGRETADEHRRRHRFYGSYLERMAAQQQAGGKKTTLRFDSCPIGV